VLQTVIDQIRSRFVQQQQQLQPIAASNAIRQSSQFDLSSVEERPVVQLPSGRTFQILVAGIPNVGKSTMINGLQRHCHAALHSPPPGTPRTRQPSSSSTGVYLPKPASPSKHTATTGPTPGVTRMVAGHWACRSPPVLLLDSPGVMMPRFDDKVAGLRLAAIGVRQRGLGNDCSITSD